MQKTLDVASLVFFLFLPSLRSGSSNAGRRIDGEIIDVTLSLSELPKEPKKLYSRAAHIRRKHFLHSEVPFPLLVLLR